MVRDSSAIVPVPRVAVREARTPSQTESAKVLFLEYRAWLVAHREVTAFPDSVLARGLGLFDQELSEFPGAYAPPKGALFVACTGSSHVGCAALRPHWGRTAELKRLFVRPEARNAGVGRRLTLRTLRHARKLGYNRVVLDTLPTMVRAIALYRAMGFQPIPAYWAHPVPGALFFEYRLRAPRILRAGRPARPRGTRSAPREGR